MLAGSLIQQLRMVKPMLVKAAANGADPAAYVEMLDGILDEETAPILAEILKQPNWLEILFGDTGPLQPHLQWFNALKKIYESEEDPEAQEEEASGDPRMDQRST